MKGLLELDPEKRSSADSILCHAFFDDVREQPTKEPSPHQVKRVHSSTYRSSKYAALDGEEEIDHAKRYPSHSQERNSMMRATGTFGTHDLRPFDTNESRLSLNNRDEHYVMGDKKKALSNTRNGSFMIKDAPASSSRKDSTNQSKREDRESRNEHNDSRGFVNAQTNGRRKVSDPKKSVSNLKMFRIRRP